jgi:hypothetical protein
MHLDQTMPQLRDALMSFASGNAAGSAPRPLILIVEKDADLISSLSAQLEAWGLDVNVLAKPATCPPANVHHFHDLVLNRVTCRVTRGGVDIPVGPTEFRLLEFLINEPGHVYSRDQLLDHVWSEVHVEPRIVDVYIAKLRRCLHVEGQPDLIRTVRGCGYALDFA